MEDDDQRGICAHCGNRYKYIDSGAPNWDCFCSRNCEEECVEWTDESW